MFSVEVEQIMNRFQRSFRTQSNIKMELLGENILLTNFCKTELVSDN